MKNDKEPVPIPNNSPPTWEKVIAKYHKRNHCYVNIIENLMLERNKIGEEKYGTVLQPNNGRDSLIDAVQECLDMIVYIENAVDEGKDRDKILENHMKSLFDMVEDLYCLWVENKGG